MKRHITLLLLLAALTPALIFGLAPAFADDDDDDRDRNWLNAAIARGEVLALSEILAKVTPEIEGRIVEIEFDYSDGAPIYEIYVLSRDGRRLEYEIDARTAKILSFENDD